GSVAVTRTDLGSGNVFYSITFLRRFGDPTFGINANPLTFANSTNGILAVSTANPGGGFTNLGVANGPGALHHISDTVTWGITPDLPLANQTTAITLATTSFIGADAGQLNLDAAVTFTGAMTKVGGGTLELRGTAANGGAGGVTVNAGTLNLNKNSVRD